MKIGLGRLLYWLLWPLTWLYRPLCMRCRVLVICGNEFLAVKPYFGSGSWQLPGGGRRKNEADASAASRELLEETGLVMPVHNLVPLCVNKEFRQNGLRLYYTIFVVVIVKKPPLTPDKNEIAACKWLPIGTSARCATSVKAALHRAGQLKLVK